MGANGSYDPEIDGVPEDKRTHIDTGFRILGHKVLLQEGATDQTKNIMNSNSEDPIYLIAKQYEDGSIAVLYVNDFTNHKLGYELNLKVDINGNLKPYNGTEQSSHAHKWHEGDDGKMHRIPVSDNGHLPIPKKYDKLLAEIEKFNKENVINNERI